MRVSDPFSAKQLMKADNSPQQPMEVDMDALLPEPLQLDEEEEACHANHQPYCSVSANISPLTKKYTSRLRPRNERVERRVSSLRSMVLPSSSTSVSPDPYLQDANSSDSQRSQFQSSISSTKSMPDSFVQYQASLFSFGSVTQQRKPHSDRFIPSRFAMNDVRDSFNVTDKFDHSPLSILRNNKRRKSMDHSLLNRRDRRRDQSALQQQQCEHANMVRSGYTSDSSSGSSSNSHKKYDQHLQHILLPTNKHNENSGRCLPNIEAKMDIDDAIQFSKPYSHHLQECPLFNVNQNKQAVSSAQIQKQTNCICDYIITQRLNYNDSPRKVLKFTSASNDSCSDNEQQPHITPCVTKQNTDSVTTTKGSKYGNDIESNTPFVNIPCDPIKSIDLLKYHKRQQLLNDYYYHLMDFSLNLNFGCIVIGDSMHVVRGHFGEMECAENNRYLHDLNRSENINSKEFHFCCIKLAPNNNRSNTSQACLGDNCGRLMFYDFVRGEYLNEIYKSNKCRISVMDWKNDYNAYNGVIAAGSLDKSIRIYDDRIFKKHTLKLKYHRGEVCGLKWNANNEHLLLSGGNQNIVCCWDLRKKSKPLFVGKHRAAIRALTWYPNVSGSDSDHMFVSGGGSNDQCIKIWNINNCNAVQPGNRHKSRRHKELYSLATGSQVCNLNYMHYNKQNYLISSHGFSSNSIIVWSLHEYTNQNRSNNNNQTAIHLQKLRQLNGHKCRVLYLSKYSDCNIVSASAGPDQTLKYWKIFPNHTQSPFVHHVSNIIR